MALRALTIDLFVITYHYSRMGDVFQEGIDGHVEQLQSVFLDSCRRGDVYSWFDYGICCSGKCVCVRACVYVWVRVCMYVYVYVYEVVV